MAKKEANFDLYIHDLLVEAGIYADTQGSDIVEINNALKTASKQQTGKAGFPEYTAVVYDFVLVMEDKADRTNLCLKEDDGTISLTVQATTDYAVNGALHYAQHILDKTSYKKIFAFGNAGDSKHHILQPIFVDEHGYKWLPEVQTFENFSENHIEEYYKRLVLEETPPEDIELADILKKAKELHEYLRNYGGLGEDEKPLVVSAILLALREQKFGFNLSQLTGDIIEKNTDGAILYQQLEKNLQRAKVAPEVKKARVLNQFTLIKDRPQLNTVRTDLRKTPLKFFAEYINDNIFKAIISNSREDYLGRFYGEFVSYSGGDGQALGVVLTPRHITELFCELVNLKPTDVIFDPCCGTGGFLISGMHRMLQGAKSEADRKHIKQEQIYGIEIRDDMFSIATTNMILRGDGQSNLICDDFLSQDSGELQLKGGGVTVGFMNPPYSQAKGKDTANLSELCFIRHLLNSVTSGGRVAVIVPVSAMIGKTKEDKAVKVDILKSHTLEGVITLNKNTFYHIGTDPCIAVFTAGEPHPSEKVSKFINFEDDGFEVKKHLGLVETERAKDRRQYLLDCWRGKQTDFPSSFMVKTTVEDTDEWLHSFYYYNDEIPTEQDFMNGIADYLTFEFNMVTHGRGYLFGYDGGKLLPIEEHGDPDCDFMEQYIREREQQIIQSYIDYIGNNAQSRDLTPLNEKQWLEFYIKDIFIIRPGKRLTKSDMLAGEKPFIGASDSNNGVTAFVSNSNDSEDKNVLGVNYNGSVVENFYHPYTCIFSDDVKRFAIRGIEGNEHLFLFLKTVILQQKSKYAYGYKFNEKRMKKQKGRL